MESNKILNMSDTDYRNAEGVANSELKLIENSQSDVIWTKSAPTDPTLDATASIGKALHCMILEPEKYHDSTLVSSVKGRATKAFEEMQSDNPTMICLTPDEAEKVKVIYASVMAHPSAAAIINAKGDCESSVFATDPETGVLLKCRPDKDCVKSLGACVDIKTTADIGAWRVKDSFGNNLRWKNPLFEYDYGHQAAFYLHVLSLYYGFEVNKFTFVVVSKTISMGKYPVGVFSVTRQELQAWGFWDRMLDNIEKYQMCHDTNTWIAEEGFSFEVIHDDSASGEVEVTFEGDNNA